MTLEIAVMHIERAIDFVKFTSGENDPFDKFALVDIESLETVIKEVKKRKEE